MIEVESNHGLYLPEADLWLDARRAQPRGFVSHAHADHYARHGSIFCSSATGALLRRRFSTPPDRIRPMEWGDCHDQGNFLLRILPAGHITGSAMLHLVRKSDGGSLLYTGDTKSHGGRTCEAARWRTADTLIIETTFGLPHFRFPPMVEIEKMVIGFVKTAMADGVVPILLGYPLGKAQEAIALLAEHGIPVVTHPSVRTMTTACRRIGVTLPDSPVLGRDAMPEGHVVVAPPQASRSKWLRAVPARRVAMLSGWGLRPGSRFRYGVDEVIPWSDHADHAGLWEIVERVKPKRVITVHGYAREFAAELRRSGIEAWSATGGDQLELTDLWPAG